MSKLFASFVLAITVSFSLCTLQTDKTLPTSHQEQDSIELPQEDPNAIGRRDFMRSKLMYSQNILEGLTTGNFGLIDESIDEIHGITRADQWVEIDNELYAKLSDDFKLSIQRLKKASETGNIEATAMRYYQMATTCIDCHSHIRVKDYDF